MSYFDLRKNLIERRNVEVDPDLAKHYLTFNNYEHQRSLRNGHIDELAEKMKDGRFRFGDIAFGVLNGISIMGNGQHQCYAIIQSEETIPCVVEKYRCSSEMDLSDLYKQFEIMGRSVKDFIRAEAGALKLKWPIHIANIVVAAAAIDYAIKNSKNPKELKGRILPATDTSQWAKKPLTKERRVKLLQDYLKEGDFVNQILTHIDNKIVPRSDTSKHLLRAPVIYTMFLTFKKDKKDALEFWINVRDGEILTKDMPEMKLREFLKSVNSHLTLHSHRVIKTHEYICRCITAWNAFRTKSKTNLAYSPARNIPTVK